MNILAIKAKLGLQTLDFSYLANEVDGVITRATDPSTKKPTMWGKHWDNDSRQAVLIHADTLAAIKADVDGVANLALKTSVETPVDKAAYTKHIIITYRAADMGSL